MPQSLHGFNELLASGWTHEEGRIAKTFRFASFGEAMSFMVGMAFVAEHMNHHPDWSNSYNRVQVSLTTHDAGGVTALDVALAQAFDAAYSRDRASSAKV
jgi:4a-hydroxytetrahydrobiopterin dehydratase